MKKLSILMLCGCLLTGCGSEPAASTGRNIENFVWIEDIFWYDSETYNVYMWNGSSNFYDDSTMPSAYFAPNGLPYKWNPQTREMEENND